MARKENMQPHPQADFMADISALWPLDSTQQNPELQKDFPHNVVVPR